MSGKPIRELREEELVEATGGVDIYQAGQEIEDWCRTCGRYMTFVCAESTTSETEIEKRGTPITYYTTVFQCRWCKNKFIQTVCQQGYRR